MRKVARYLFAMLAGALLVVGLAACGQAPPSSPTLDRSKRDGYPGNEQPRDASLSLYDRQSGTVVEEIRDIDPVWSP